MRAVFVSYAGTRTVCVVFLKDQLSNHQEYCILISRELLSFSLRCVSLHSAVSGVEQLLWLVWLRIRKTCSWYLLRWPSAVVVCNGNSSYRLVWLFHIWSAIGLAVWLSFWSVHMISGTCVRRHTESLVDLERFVLTSQWRRKYFKQYETKSILRIFNVFFVTLCQNGNPTYM